MSHKSDRFQVYSNNKRTFSLNSENYKSINFKIVEVSIQQNHNYRQKDHSKYGLPPKVIILTPQNSKQLKIKNIYYATNINTLSAKQPLLAQCPISHCRLKTHAFHTNPQTMTNYETLQPKKIVQYKEKVNFHHALNQQSFTPIRLSRFSPHHQLKYVRSSSNLKFPQNQRFSNQRVNINNFNFGSTIRKNQKKLIKINSDKKTEYFLPGVKFYSTNLNSQSLYDENQNNIKSKQQFKVPFLYYNQKNTLSDSNAFSFHLKDKSEKDKNKTVIKSIHESIKTKDSLKHSITSLWDAHQVVSILAPLKDQMQVEKSYFNQCNQISYLISQKDEIESKNQTLKMESYIKDKYSYFQKNS